MYSYEKATKRDVLLDYCRDSKKEEIGRMLSQGAVWDFCYKDLLNFMFAMREIDLQKKGLEKKGEKSPIRKEKQTKQAAKKNKLNSRKIKKRKLKIKKVKKRKIVRAVEQFVGGISYETLKKESSPSFLTNLFEWIDRQIEDYEIRVRENLPAADPIYLKPLAELLFLFNLEQAIPSLRASLAPIPPVLLQSFDFSEAKSLCVYQTQAECEGYFEPDFMNEEVYTQSSKYKEMSREEKINFRNKIKDTSIIQSKDYTGPINEKHRYPIPEIETWPGQQNFLEIIYALNYLCRNENKILFLRKVLPPKLLDALYDESLYLRSMVSAYRGSAHPRLAISAGYTNCDFNIFFNKGRGMNETLLWTEAFPSYVDEFNMLPSFEFFEKVEVFLKACQEQYNFRKAGTTRMLESFLKKHGIKQDVLPESKAPLSFPRIDLVSPVRIPLVAPMPVIPVSVVIAAVPERAESKGTSSLEGAIQDPVTSYFEESPLPLYQSDSSSLDLVLKRVSPEAPLVADEPETETQEKTNLILEKIESALKALHDREKEAPEFDKLSIAEAIKNLKKVMLILQHFLEHHLTAEDFAALNELRPLQYLQFFEEICREEALLGVSLLRVENLLPPYEWLLKDGNPILKKGLASKILAKQTQVKESKEEAELSSSELPALHGKSEEEQVMKAVSTHLPDVKIANLVGLFLFAPPKTANTVVATLFTQKVIP